MKATIEIPDDLYRQVKAKSALEGRAVREVTEALFRRYVDPREAPEVSAKGTEKSESELFDGQPSPPWFGVFKEYADRVADHDMASIRQSIAAGIVEERGL
ncbi:MAG TPA: hypothetical protein VN851_00495 [Thermoanaerobaculia bacterium]|nr:hypothetical protein [Thermoanaerobaculia bacterium]